MSILNSNTKWISLMLYTASVMPKKCEQYSGYWQTKCWFRVKNYH